LWHHHPYRRTKKSVLLKSDFIGRRQVVRPMLPLFCRIASFFIIRPFSRYFHPYVVYLSTAMQCKMQMQRAPTFWPFLYLCRQQTTET
jgi:hypothetical protein